MRKKLTTALEAIKNEESEEEYEEIDLEDFTFSEVSANYNIEILVLKYFSIFTIVELNQFLKFLSF